MRGATREAAATAWHADPPLSRGQALAAFAQLDTDQHPLGIDVADPQHDDLAAAQTGAIGDAERGLVLETGAGRGLDQPGHLLPSQHPRQLPRIVRAGQLMGEVGAAERDSEEEAQRRGLRIHLRWLRTLLDLCELEAADVVAARGIGGAAEIWQRSRYAGYSRAVSCR